MLPRKQSSFIGQFTAVSRRIRLPSIPHLGRQHRNMSSNPRYEKNSKFGHLPLSTSGAQETSLTVCQLVARRRRASDSEQGNALLRTPYFNKGSAFTKDERETFKLHGLLPTNIQTLDEQVKRAYAQYSSRPNDLAKNTFMTSLKEQNEVLYYRV